MRTYSVSEARRQLSRLVAQAAAGEPFVITKAGRPLVKVMAIETIDTPARKRLGFLAGQISVPSDFDEMGAAEIEEMFNGPDS
jgi:prevent-host-death family protein